MVRKREINEKKVNELCNKGKGTDTMVWDLREHKHTENGMQVCECSTLQEIRQGPKHYLDYLRTEIFETFKRLQKRIHAAH